MTSLLNSLRSETTKLFSMRSTLVYAILLAGSLFGPVTLMGFFGDSPDFDWSTITFGYQIFLLIAVVFAAATTAGDIRNHMHAQAFLTQRGRGEWVVAKMLTTAVFVAVLYLVGTALSLGVAAVLGSGMDLGTGLSMFYVPLLGSVIFSAMTVGLACIIRSQVAAVAVPVAWVLLIDSMLGFAAEQIEAFRPLAAIAPVQRQDQLISGADPLGLGISAMVCYLIIVAWFLVLAGLGLWRNSSSDVR
ncbi:ABC transporter permease [Corynebacterium glyciniphilum]|uniref:Putative ABC-type putative sugar transporter, permease subunit n=1 Tax=Corynebacterium glyciniphilum AJ 3170 TaxID=1404245 RepID=X5DKM5_9CORY|nr:ABC transporter permease [Corynebacterium glyciniphilum]AHW63668.1 Putative ABC-type putative sugar transporter, permease subunit [Corynebacterium glyciniphilum AJ 3170]